MRIRWLLKRCIRSVLADSFSGRRSGSRRTRVRPIEAPSKFLQAAAGAPLHNIFWLRFLEKKQRNQQSILQSTTAELAGAANVEAGTRSWV